MSEDGGFGEACWRQMASVAPPPSIERRARLLSRPQVRWRPLASDFGRDRPMVPWYCPPQQGLGQPWRRTNSL